MTRESIRTDYTEDEIKNLESKKCFCGKPRSEFAKGMRVYCSIECRTDWYQRTISWSEFKDIIISEHGKKCAKCGCTPESLKQDNKSDYVNWLNEVKQNLEVMKSIEITRIKKLNELEEKYQEIMSDDYLINYEFGYRSQNMPVGLRQRPENDNFTSNRFEVDHILAVSLGGEMWDKKNLQVLCYTDHKIKTKSDMSKLKAKRRGLRPFVESS